MMNSLRIIFRQSKLLKYQTELQKSVENDKKNLAYAYFIPKNWNENQILKQFAQFDMHIKRVTLVKDATNSSTGRALIELTTEEKCTEFVQKYGRHLIDTHDVLQEIAIKPFALKKETKKLEIQRNMKQAYITGLPRKMSNDELLEMISDFGEIVNVQIPKDTDGVKNKGYAFVLFNRSADAVKFMTFMNGKNFMGKQIGVQIQHFRFDSQKPQYEQKKLSESSVQNQQNKILFSEVQKQYEI